MRFRTRFFILNIVIAACAAWAQAPAEPRKTDGTLTGLPVGTGSVKSQGTSQPPAIKPAPKLSDTEMDVFLRTATIKTKEVLTAGTTGSIKAVLTDGKLTHDAHIQCLDVYKPVWRGAEGTVEKNFRDSWKFNVAAYRLNRLLGLNMVPMSVEREVEGKLCSVTWWVDNVWLVEHERRDKGIKPPATDYWVNQLNTVRVFDQLIHNLDRNQGNLLITAEWKLWMIDHTRAFKPSKTLLKPDSLRRIDKGLLAKLEALNTVALKQELGPWLRAEEIAALLSRRDEILRFFQKEIREKGEEAVLTGLTRSTPQVSVP
jgi:hypothetical protein